MNVSALFKKMVVKRASDLFLTGGTVPHARIDGVVREIDTEVVSQKEMVKIVDALLETDDQKARFQEKQGLDFIHVEPNIGRFRVNVFVQRGTPALVARHVKTSTETFEALNLPERVLTDFCNEANGIVLVCGPAGSGKSTTIASMLDLINQNQEKHIVTIEDPIEFLFQHKKSIINQRELEVDVKSYPDALKHITQQSPDIIYIGNIRDLNTMRAAITAAELGTFVVSTFHTINAVQTITRIVNFFPPYLHSEVYLHLSILLKGIVSLRLIPRNDQSGRVPAYETMVVTPTIASLIREGRVDEIQQYIEEGQLYGMQSFKTSLVSLVKNGLVRKDDARRFASSKDEFDMALQGISRYKP